MAGVSRSRQMLSIIAMFMIVQFSGILFASFVFSGSSYSQVSSVHVLSSLNKVIFYIFYIAVLALILVFIMKIYKGDKLFIAFEGVVIFIASFFIFLIAIGELTHSVQSSLFSSSISAQFIAAAILALLLVIAKNKWQRLRNTAAIIASIGVGVVLGISFSFALALLFMGLLAIYDFIAVFITKHMITIANAAVNRNLALFIGASEIEALPKSDFTKAEVMRFEEMRKRAKRKPPIISALKGKGLVPVEVPAMLGTGDLAVPLMVSISAYSATLSFTLSFFVAIGAVFGLILTMFMLQRLNRALPAIPPLLLGVLVFVGLYMLIY
ncbi:MAG: presenilin family intramembrane aspartyl protease [Candidatus Micrarchaeaceae archaeon]